MKKSIFFLFIFLLFHYSCSNNRNKHSRTVLKVNAVYVKNRIIKEKIYAVGTISYIEKVEITSKVTGKVEKVYVDIGSIVRKGTPLLQIDKFPLEIELKKVKAELESAKSALQLAEAKYKESLKRVEQQIKVIEKAQANLSEKKAAYENMKKIIKRKETLYKMGAITEEEYENLKTELKSYETKYQLAEKELQIQLNGYRDEDIIKNGYKVPLNKKDKIKLLKLINTRVEKAEVDVQKAKVKNAEANIESINLLLKKTTVKSPISGIVASRNIEPGERIVKDSPLLVVMNIDKVYAILNIPESQVNKIKRNDRIELFVDAIPDNKFYGYIFLISPVIDLKTRTIEIRGKFNNPDHLLKPGMFARGYIYTGKKRKSILIPTSSIVTSNSNCANVFIVANNDEVYSKKIKFVESSDENIEVLSGLKEGDLVVINKTDQLNEGDKVEVEVKNE